MTDEQWNGIRDWATGELQGNSRQSHFIEVEEFMRQFQLEYPFWNEMVARAKGSMFTVHAATKYSRDAAHPEMDHEPAGQIEFRRVLRYGKLR